MCSDEVSGESVAEPVACAGLYGPVFPASLVAESPCVETDGDVEGPFLIERDFGTEVDVEEGVVDEVGFYGNILSHSAGGER